MEDYKKQLAFVNDIIDIFNVSPSQTRIGVAIFSDQPEIVVPLNSGLSKDQIKKRVTGSRYIHGVTHTSTALEYVREHGFAVARQNVGHVLIVVTDGYSRKPHVTAAEALTIRNQGVHIFAIGVGKQIDHRELENMANTPSDDFIFHVENYDSLASIKTLLAVQTCRANNIVYDTYGE